MEDRLKNLFVCFCISGAAAVALGAFGAHALKDSMTESDMQNFKSANLYHFIHTLAGLMILTKATRLNESRVIFALYLFLVGIVLFSGSLYLGFGTQYSKKYPWTYHPFWRFVLYRWLADGSAVMEGCREINVKVFYPKCKFILY
jgi:uncharacterized membrane protein YgdD (TMEM256/DUF423 family)